MTLAKGSVSSRQKRHFRIRIKISGTTERPRLCVFRSSKHISAQIIDDQKGTTLVHASTLEKDFKENRKSGIEAAGIIGEKVAKRALEAGIKTVVFDRGGFIYHGRVAALAEAARSAGLEF